MSIVALQSSFESLILAGKSKSKKENKAIPVTGLGGI
jgi:hypothetical protein